MQKWLIAVAFTGCILSAQSQVQSGTLVDSGRKVVGTADFKVVSATSGTVVIEVAVNRKGEVTGAKVIHDATTIKSTPSVMKAVNAAKKLKFTPGTVYAEFEHARVKYTYAQ